AVTAEEGVKLVERGDIAFIDLREQRERVRHGEIPGSVCAPYKTLKEQIASGGAVRELARNRQLVFYCAFGERSALAVRAARDAGIDGARHLHGGIDAWKRAEGPIKSV